MKEDLRILELFSGIGGMHFSFKRSGAVGEIKAAIDINPVANKVYKHNFPNITILNNNIQSINSKLFEKLNVNMILMSPPCQPFTRVGKQRDTEDNRTDALKHICDILPQLNKVEYILMENVKGFETSNARIMYVAALKESGFFYREFILSPSQFGVPNQRCRYFCLARKKKDFSFDQKLWECMPNNDTTNAPYEIENILETETNISEDFYLSDELLKKRLMLLDIVHKKSSNSICFTKAYTHYSEGTGSVFSSLSQHDLDGLLKTITSIEKDSLEYEKAIKSLKLRYFTPQEVARLMCFPGDFQFPKDTTNKQKYRLLGNSINILVVSNLIRLLIN